MSGIPFIDLSAQRRRLGSKIDEAVLRVIDHGKFIMGPEVSQLEADLAEYSGAEHVISCSSGTDALLMPLMAWGVGQGDAVFLPSFTFAATAEVVALLGATPIFVDVTRDTFNMDAASLKKAIMVAKTENLNLAAVIPVGLFGLPADFDTIMPLAQEEGMKVLDDAAQSFGASYKGTRVGQIGDAIATSFFPAKPLGCYGDGGAVFTDNGDLANRIRSIRVHGKGRHKYDNERIGLNARMDTLQAAVLIEKLKIFSDELERRQAVADRYDRGLDNVVVVPKLPAQTSSAWAQYTVLVENDRDGTKTSLNDVGVPSVVYYPLPLHRQTAYKHFPIADGGNPNSDWLSQRVLSLPMHPYLDDDNGGRVIDSLINALT